MVDHGLHAVLRDNRLVLQEKLVPVLRQTVGPDIAAAMSGPAVCPCRGLAVVSLAWHGHGPQLALPRAPRHRYLQTEKLIYSMLQLPRAEFMPPSLRSGAYELSPSRIEALAFNISAPNMYSFCLEQLKLEEGHAFLDIGAGCGMLTALGAQLVSPPPPRTAQKGRAEFCLTTQHLQGGGGLTPPPPSDSPPPTPHPLK